MTDQTNQKPDFSGIEEGTLVEVYKFLREELTCGYNEKHKVKDLLWAINHELEKRGLVDGLYSPVKGYPQTMDGEEALELLTTREKFEALSTEKLKEAVAAMNKAYGLDGYRIMHIRRQEAGWNTMNICGLEYTHSAPKIVFNDGDGDGFMRKIIPPTHNVLLLPPGDSKMSRVEYVFDLILCTDGHVIKDRTMRFEPPTEVPVTREALETLGLNVYEARLCEVNQSS